MVRRFTDEPVPAGSLDRILRDGVRGQAAGFSPWWTKASAPCIPASWYFGIVPEAVGPFGEAFGVPDDHEPIGVIAIGHDAEAAARDLRARRRHAAEVIGMHRIYQRTRMFRRNSLVARVGVADEASGESG
jgi:hypothetical protein